MEEVFVAKDADARVTNQVVELAEELNVPIVEVDSKHELGKACDIEVDASTVAIRKE